MPKQEKKKIVSRNSVPWQTWGLGYGVLQNPLLRGLTQIIAEHTEMNPSFQPQIAFKPSRCYSSCGKKNLKRINRAGGVISMRLGEQNHSKLQCHLPLVARQCVGLSEKLRMVGWDMDMACREGAEAPDGHTWFSLNPGAGGIRGAEGA